MREAIRREFANFRPLDFRREIANHCRFGTDTGTRRGLGNNFRFRGENPPRFTADHLRPEVCELTERGTVERCRGHLTGTECRKPSAEFASRLLRESHRKRSSWIVHAGADGMCDSMGDRACFTRAGTRVDDDRTCGGKGHGTLVVVEIVEMHGGSLRSPSDAVLRFSA